MARINQCVYWENKFTLLYKNFNYSKNAVKDFDFILGCTIFTLILGPLLFLLYVNDMVQAVTCDLFLYADDACLTSQHENVTEIEDKLNLNFSSL